MLKRGEKRKKCFDPVYHSVMNEVGVIEIAIVS